MLEVEIEATGSYAIWLPRYDGEYPPCYHGSPLDVVQGLARDFCEHDVSPDEAVDILVADLETATGTLFNLPAAMALPLKAATLLGFLLATGLAREQAVA